MNNDMPPSQSQPSPFSYELATHDGKNVIFIRFDYDKQRNEEIRKVAGARWSRSQKAWYVTDNAHNRRQFGFAPPLAGKEVLAHIHPVNQPAFQTYIETLQLKAYSQSTIRTYRNEFAQLLYLLKDVPVDSLDVNRLRSYFLYCINTLKLSENTLHSRINAVKFYYEQVLHREKFFLTFHGLKKPGILPEVIFSADIKRLFAVTTNLKHNTMLKLCYGMWPRVSEIVNLKITDVDSKAMQVFIERAKGKKTGTSTCPKASLNS